MAMRTMLSFDKGTPIAHALDKRGNKLQTIFVTQEKDKPDIEVDDVNELIDEDDYLQIKKMLRLNSIEIKIIKKAISTGRTESLNDRLKLALMSLKEIATKKLKNHLLFSKSDEIDRIVPLLGGGGYDRSIFLTGASGSGKSFLAKEIIKRDEQERPIVVFSKIDDDKSLNELKKLKITKKSFPDDTNFDDSAIKKELGAPRMIKIRLDTEDDLANLPSNEELKNCVCLFDDIDSFPQQIADTLNAYRNIILESGRHKNITVISTSHQLYNWTKTKTILNEAQMVCMFPHSNKRSSKLFLRDRMDLGKSQIDSIMSECMDCSRFLICKVSFPPMCMHDKGIILI